jgi:preprotein translocase subunit SecF
MKAGFKEWYKENYKILLYISIVLLLVSVAAIGFRVATTGEVFAKGVSLKGGLTLTIPVDTTPNTQLLQSAVEAALPDAETSVRALASGGTVHSLIIESSENNAQAIIAALRSSGQPVIDGSYTTEFIGSSLGESFYTQTIMAIILAFIFMGMVVFLTFRSITPSLFVMLAALSDIISTTAVIGILDIRLSTAGIAAFLMLIGYSVDTDILLTTRVLKSKEGTVVDRIESALKTGLVMSATSIAAVSVAYFVSDSETIKQIMLILGIGLVFDVIYTWFQNASILRWTLEK